MKFWLVAAPADGNSDRAWAELSSRCAPACSRCERVSLPMGTLRVGTLDKLLTLSDELAREVPRVEATLQRLFASLSGDAQASTSTPAPLSPSTPSSSESLLTRFVWNAGLYRTDLALRSVLDEILDRVARIEDTFKVQKDEMIGCRQRVQAAERAETGSLLLRDVGDLLHQREGLIIESLHLTTLLVVVPAAGVAEWSAAYESLVPMVVPRSAVQVAEDREHTMFTVTLFAKAVPDFRRACRERRYTVRECPGWQEARSRIEHVGGEDVVEKEGEGGIQEDRGGGAQAALEVRNGQPKKESLGDLRKAYEVRLTAFADWCAQSYREVAEAYIHASVLRLFAESVLRYGLPPDFLPAVLVPSRGQSKALRKTLEGLYGGVGNAEAGSEGADDDLSALMDKVSVGTGQDEFFSYVSLVVELPDVQA